MPDEKEKNTEDLQKKLEECQKLKDEYLAGWQREKADFLNYKKGGMERIGEILKYGNLDLILKILPILDNFDLVEKKLPENLKNDKTSEVQPSVDYGASIKGFLQIKRQLENFLKSQGVEEIKSVGEKFDPHLHEVIEDVPSEALAKEGKKTEPGTVIEEIQKGYKINGKVIRPAKVRITK